MPFNPSIFKTRRKNRLHARLSPCFFVARKLSSKRINSLSLEKRSLMPIMKFDMTKKAFLSKLKYFLWISLFILISFLVGILVYLKG